jgi:hypothetical protein
LELWSEEGAAAVSREPKPVSGLFFLGDSYLVYDFAYLGGTSAHPTLSLQSADSVKVVHATAAELTELSGLIVAARHDVTPQQPYRAVHTTCIVFLDAAGNYFAVQPDESKNSRRPTDKAIALLERLSQGAP